MLLWLVNSKRGNTASVRSAGRAQGEINEARVSPELWWTSKFREIDLIKFNLISSLFSQDFVCCLALAIFIKPIMIA